MNTPDLPPNMIEKNRVTDLTIGGSEYGASIPEVFGAGRIEGNVIWQSEIRSVVTVTREVTDMGKAGDMVNITSTYAYFVDFALLLTKGQIFGIRKIWANTKLIFNVAEDADPATLTASEKLLVLMTVHTGAATQSADPTMQSAKGISLTPAHNGYSILVFTNFDVTAHGARVPSMSLEVVQAGLLTGSQITPIRTSIASTIDTLCIRGGLLAGQVDTTLLVSEASGITVTSGNYRSAIETLMTGYDIGSRLSGDKVVFYPLSGNSVVTIQIEELGAFDSANISDPAGLLSIQRKQEVELPRMVQVTAKDAKHDYQPITQTAVRQTGKARGEQKFNISISLTATDAKRLAEAKLYRAWIERTKYKFKLPFKYLRLEPGDVITIVGDATYTMRLTNVIIGVNGILDCMAIAHDSAIFDQVADGVENDGGIITITEPGASQVLIFNSPAMESSQLDVPGFFVAATGSAAGWKGANVLVSFDAGITYQIRGVVTAPSTMGVANTILPDANHHVWDNTSILDVTLVRGTLASSTDAQVLLGANRMRVGEEIIQFVNATLIGTNQYRLTRLLRGRKGTEEELPYHYTGDSVALMNGSVPFIPIDISNINSELMIKVVPFYSVQADAEPEYFFCSGQNLRPYSPCHASMTSDLSNNITLNWIRRSRIGQELPSGTDIPVGEYPEYYEIEILSFDGTLTLRQMFSSTTSVAYSAADQITDFGSVQTSVNINVFQRSAAVGRGAVLNAIA